MGRRLNRDLRDQQGEAWEGLCWAPGDRKRTSRPLFFSLGVLVTGFSSVRNKRDTHSGLLRFFYFPLFPLFYFWLRGIPLFYFFLYFPLFCDSMWLFSSILGIQILFLTNISFLREAKKSFIMWPNSKLFLLQLLR